MGKITIYGATQTTLESEKGALQDAVALALCLASSEILNLQIKVPNEGNDPEELWVIFRMGAPRTETSRFSSSDVSKAVADAFQESQSKSSASLETLLKQKGIAFTSANEFETFPNTNYLPEGVTAKPTGPPTETILEDAGNEGLSTGAIVAISASSFVAVVIGVSLIFVSRGKSRNLAKHKDLVRATTPGFGTADAGIQMAKTSALASNPDGTAMMQNPISKGQASSGGWESAVDPKSGKTYYYNRETGKRVWRKPAGMHVQASV